MKVKVASTYHSKFGATEKSLYDLVDEAVLGVFENSPIKNSQIDGVWIGNYSGGGFNKQEHMSALALDKLGKTHIPCVRVENACASGSSALLGARNAILSGMCSSALVIGVEKMTSLDTKGVTNVLAMASHAVTEAEKGFTFPGLFAEFAKGYMEKYDVDEETMQSYLRKIASKNYKNALKNDKAHMPRDWSEEDIANLPDKKNPMIAYPLKLHDCSLVSDGVACIILTKEDLLENPNDFVELVDICHVTDYLEISKRKNYEFTGAKVAVKQLYERNNITAYDLDFAEVHDCFTIAELLAYEALQIAEDGKAFSVLDEGVVYPSGILPVNASGGLKAKGHPVGATGVSMAVVATRQLQGNPLGEKIDNAKLGVTLNLGGSAVNSYACLFKK
ncbi:MAG: thiolase C-terminal domain-containing protein [Lachnospirales bacterium]